MCLDGRAIKAGERACEVCWVRLTFCREGMHSQLAENDICSLPEEYLEMLTANDPIGLYSIWTDRTCFDSS